MKLKVYEYKSCGTCRKALKWLDGKGIAYEAVPIRDTPPSKAELKKMLKHCDGALKRLFNTSGMDYKAMKMKDKLPGLSEADALDLLAGNGNLVKRPFVIGKDVGLVGFKEEVWEESLG
jgi:arsenate reductase